MHTTKRHLIIEIDMRFFRRLKISYALWQRRASRRGSRCAHLLILTPFHYEELREYLHSHTMLLLHLGYQIQVKESQQQNTSEFVAMINYYFEGKLISQTGLKIKEEWILTRSLVSEKFD